MKYLICIPTYNEAENIKKLLKTISKLKLKNVDILVIDDNSPDGTSNIVKEIIKSKKLHNRIFIMDRNKKEGLGKAYVAGFKWALKKGYDYAISMDADFSHDPKYLPKMIEKSIHYDVVIGSRYIKGGSIKGWKWFRYINSMGANYFTRMILGLKVKDATAGFKCYNKKYLNSLDLDNIISGGYAFMVEMVYLAQEKGVKITEFPITFVDRREGESKISGELSRSAKTVMQLAQRRSGLMQFIKFGIVGVSGTIVDLGFYNLLTILFGVNIYIARSISFVLGATNNYIWNRIWTFKSRSKNISKEYIKFFVVSLVGLAMNLGIMKLLEPFSNRFSSELLQNNIPVIIAIAVVLVWNFFINKFWTFRK